MTTTKLRTGPDIDWRSRCLPGDSQGQSNACTVFAIASWAEVMLATEISNIACIDAYQKERAYRQKNGGLQITEAFAAATVARMLPRGTMINRVYDLQTLSLAPIVAGYKGVRWVAAANGSVSTETSESDHAVLIVGHIAGRVWIENSHGPAWGAGGFGSLSEAQHLTHCTQLWQIVLPGEPVSETEAEQRASAKLSEIIGDQVRSINANLITLGYHGLPASSLTILPDILTRSMSKQFDFAQELAKGNLASVYLLLRQQGITDQQINAVWTALTKTGA